MTSAGTGDWSYGKWSRVAGRGSATHPAHLVRPIVAVCGFEGLQKLAVLTVVLPGCQFRVFCTQVVCNALSREPNVSGATNRKKKLHNW